MSRVHVRASLCALLIAALSQHAFAHFVWVVTGGTSSDAPSIQVYFGEAPEPGDPELLSYLEGVELMLLGSSGEPTAVELEQGEAALVGSVELGEGIVFGSRDLGEMERGGSRFALKYHFKSGPHYGSDSWKSTDTKEHLPLDVVPQKAANGDLVVHAFWRGQPLAGAEVVVSHLDAPPEKATTGEDGTFTLASPKPGLLGVRVKHSSEDPSAEIPENHYTTLTFRVPAPSPIRSDWGPEYPLAVSSHGAAFSDGYLYVYGGHAGITHRYSTETTSGRFFRWGPSRFGANDWEELDSDVHVQGMGLVAHRGALYRVGGARPRNAPGEKHDMRSVGSCSVYRPENGEWESFTELPAPRSSFDAVVWNDTLIVTGGWEMRGEGEQPVWSDTTLMLDLNQPDAEWRTVQQPFERRALGCSVVGDKLYVVGGLTQDGDVERFVDVLDLNTLEWSHGPELPGGRMNGFTPAICSFGGDLWASPADGKLYRMSADGTAWDVLGELEHSRFVHRMVPIDERTLAVLGGASMEGNRKSVELIEIRGATALPVVEASAAVEEHAQAQPASSGKQERCPVMRSDFVYEDSNVVSFNGVEVLVCCDSCEKRWNREPEAYLDVAVLPQLKDAELPARKLEQVYCPVYRDRVVSSQDPSAEHDGKTLHFFSRSARDRFVKDPSKYPVDDALFSWSGTEGTH
ncbi:MAG: kelch repeat-containing protein [Planctomycetota bacterium]